MCCAFRLVGVCGYNRPCWNGVTFGVDAMLLLVLWAPSAVIVDVCSGVGGSDMLPCVMLPFAIEGDGPTWYSCQSPRCGIGWPPLTTRTLPATEWLRLLNRASGIPSPVCPGGWWGRGDEIAGRTAAAATAPVGEIRLLGCCCSLPS